MRDRLADIESRLDRIEHRIAALERQPTAASEPRQAAPEPALDGSLLTDVSAHVGRVLLIFGGAYLLRAITDFKFVPTGIGILMGASYALFWLFMGYRKSAQAGLRALATFYGGTSVLLALPLLVEAISHFELLSGMQGLVALALFSTLALGVAATRRLRILAWFVVAGAVVTAFAILIVARLAVPTAVVLLLLGFGSLWVMYRYDLRGPRWLGALGANLGVGSLIVFASHDQWSLTPWPAALLAAVLLVGYFASFAVHTHVARRDVGVFEIVQSLLAAVLGAAAVVAAGPAGFGAAGALGVGLGAASYALALQPATRLDHGINFYFYVVLGLVLVVPGSVLLLGPSSAAPIWAVLAVAFAIASGRSGWVILSLESTLLLLLAGAASGLLAAGLEAFVADGPLPPPRPAHAAVAVATVVCLFVPVAQHSERWGVLAGAPQLTVLALSVWEVGGLIVLAGAALAGIAQPVEADAGLIAALRSAVLAAAAVTLALSSRHPRWPEARWLVYPVLVLVGVKLFLEDFPHGRPVTLFVALAFIGGALLAVARLFGRRVEVDPTTRSADLPAGR